MEAIVLVILPALILVASAIMGFAFLTEAFRLPRGLASTARAELPLLRGDDLRHWAADRSKSIVAKYLAGPRTKMAAVIAAREVERQASRIVDDVLALPQTTQFSGSLCPDRGREPISLTVPEAMAVAEELRSKLSTSQVRRVVKLARDNLEASTRPTPAATTGDASVCPLLADDGHCLVFSARPLHCRGRMSDPTRQTAKPAEFAATVTDGMQQGLCVALTAAGLDGRCYELNRSLIDVLDQA